MKTKQKKEKEQNKTRVGVFGRDHQALYPAR